MEHPVCSWSIYHHLVEIAFCPCERWMPLDTTRNPIPSAKRLQHRCPAISSGCFRPRNARRDARWPKLRSEITASDPERPSMHLASAMLIHCYRWRITPFRFMGRHFSHRASLSLAAVVSRTYLRGRCLGAKRLHEIALRDCCDQLICYRNVSLFPSSVHQWINLRRLRLQSDALSS